MFDLFSIIGVRVNGIGLAADCRYISGRIDRPAAIRLENDRQPTAGPMTFLASKDIMNPMMTTHSKQSQFNKVWSPLARLATFFRRLQWRLTLNYALFTAVTALALGIVASGLLWYVTFWSDGMPRATARDLLRTGTVLAPYLDQTPTDQAGLDNWLHEGMAGRDNLMVRLPARDRVDDAPPPPPPPRFDRVISLAVVDRAGQVVLSYPAGEFTLNQPLLGQLTAEASGGYQAALAGVTDLAALATRSATGNSLAAAPVLGSNGQPVGAIFIEIAPPFTESEFLQFNLGQTILPVFVGVLAVGGIAGVLFGYFIARDLTRRLRVLAGAADAWSKGDFDVLVADSSGDELSQLAQHLNQMALQLQTLLQTRQELAMIDERNRLARDLHDAVKQQVFATAMQVGAALTFFDDNPAAAKSCIIETDRLVHQTQKELTSLIQELRPAALEDKGLAVAVREYVTDWSRQNNIAAEVRVKGEQPLPFLIEQTLFRVTQEALANMARHSEATLVKVHLAWEDEQVFLTLADNGRGFNPASISEKGLGLRSMRERVAAIGGQLTVTSQPEEGTRIIVLAPNSDKL